MIKFFSLILIVILFNSCSIKKEESVSKVIGKNLEEQMIEAYKTALEALDKGDVIFAAKKFNEAELLYPQSDWAPKSSLMASYAYWSQGYYNDSILELKRFIKLYPKDKNLDYAYYLLAINYYDSIIDEKKDLKPLEESKKFFTFILKNYPDSDYASDGKYKLELIEDILAAKEMYIARHYLKKEKWIAAINRFKKVVTYYDTTEYTPEALHRLVEVYYRIGLVEESKKYASVLGYNYLSNQWYKETYKIYNKKYSDPVLKIKKNKKSLLEKFKSLF